MDNYDDRKKNYQNNPNYPRDNKSGPGLGFILLAALAVVVVILAVRHVSKPGNDYSNIEPAAGNVSNTYSNTNDMNTMDNTMDNTMTNTTTNTMNNNTMDNTTRP